MAGGERSSAAGRSPASRGGSRVRPREFRSRAATRSVFPARSGPTRSQQPAAGEQDDLSWFDATAFVPSPAGEYGTTSAALVRLPGRHQWDFALSKNLALRGAKRLQVRVDLINAFNHTQFLDVNTSCFGVTTCVSTSSSGFGQVTSARPPREIQLGARFDW